MSDPPPPPALLRRQIERLFEQRGDRAPRVLAFRSGGPWRGEESFQAGDRRCVVRWCPSALAVREALDQTAESRDTLVLLTDRSEADLGLDVLSRLPKRRLLEIDRWGLLMHAFEAGRLDSRLLQDRWLADELLASLPSAGYPSVPSGTLDLDTAWRSFLDARLGIPDGATDLLTILQWSREPAASAMKMLSEEVASAVLARLARESGQAASAVARLARGERPHDALPVGLVCRVLFEPLSEEPPGRQQAAVRLEPLLGGEALTREEAQRWATEAEAELCRLELDEPVVHARALARAEEILTSLKAEPWAYLSVVLHSGLQRGQQRFATALSTALAKTPADASPDLDRVAQQLTAYRGHQPVGAEHVEMACRLLRWLGTEERSPTRWNGFGQAITGYTEQIALVDEARTMVSRWAGQVADDDLARALGLLLTRVGTARHALNRQFGELAAGWFAGGSLPDEVVPVEAFLERVAAPVAAQHPVLVLVIDGMSLAVFHELVGDVFDRGWGELTPGGTNRLVGLAALPSITAVSRSALLTGRFERGGQAVERAGFARHPALRSAGSPNLPPVLFHKADLQRDGAAGLSEELRLEIARRQRRVVGVVFNAVDDRLLKGEQLIPVWTVDVLTPLAALLDAAAEAERAILITSDHGHVLEWGLDLHSVTESGDRHRTPGGKTEDGEIRIAGQRVVTDGSEAVVAWSETLRYGRRKAGYHGGASPQELLVPIGVLVPGDAVLEGWETPTAELPGWWLPQRGIEQEAQRESAPKVPSRQTLGKAPQISLFDPAEGLLDRLFASDLYGDQVAGLAAGRDSEARVRALLVEIETHGFAVSLEALERLLRVGRPRLRGLLTQAQRILNLDGYAVLDLDETTTTVRLDRALLRRQFGLGSDR